MVDVTGRTDYDVLGHGSASQNSSALAAPKTSAPQNGEKEESLDEAEREREKTEKQLLQEILDEFRKANANNDR